MSQLHFANPSAYQDIYSPAARWDKEKTLYEAFGEDHSSFGLLTYGESKQRKDVLQPMFSRRAILGMQSLVRQNVWANKPNVHKQEKEAANSVRWIILLQPWRRMMQTANHPTCCSPSAVLQ
jgi:hypothetical protein